MRKIEFRGVVIDLGINDMELHVNVNDESVGIIIDLYQNKDGDPVYQEWSSVIDIDDLTPEGGVGMKKNNGFDYDGTALEKYPDECPCCGGDNSDGEDGWCRNCRGLEESK